MINWKQKLSSRKFWVALSGIVTALLAIFKVDANTTLQVTTVIGALGVMAAYILAEGYADGKRNGS